MSAPRLMFSIIGGNGDEIPLDVPELTPQPELARMRGGSGWGAAPRMNLFFESATEGALYRGTRVLPRLYMLPLAAFGSSALEVESRVRRLVRATHGLMLLRARYSDGRAFQLPVVYESGLEGVYGLMASSRGTVFEEVILKTAGSPYWASQQSQSVEWRNATQYEFLETLTLSASSLSGSRIVQNRGDVATRPSWRAEGPFTSVMVETSDGSFVFEPETPFEAGQRLLIEWTGWGWSVVDDTGANVYPGLAGTPRFPILKPGSTVVTLNVAGADADTRVTAWWTERREVVF